MSDAEPFRVKLDKTTGAVRVQFDGFIAMAIEPAGAVLLVNGRTVSLPRRLKVRDRLGAQPKAGAVLICRREHPAGPLRNNPPLVPQGDGNG